MFDDYAYYSKKEVVSDAEQPVYGTNDRGKEEKQYTMGVLSLPSNTGTGDTSTNPDTGSDSSASGLEVTPKDIFDAASNRKADTLKAIGDYYTGAWYDDTDTHQFNPYGFTPLMMATQAQCYESIEYILGKINKNKLYTPVHQLHEKITDSDSSKRSAIKIAEDNDDELAIKLLLENAFIKTDDSKKIADDVTLYVDRKYYSVLNKLYEKDQLDLEDANNKTIENALENASIILTAVHNNSLDSNKLEGWQWWDGVATAKLSFVNPDGKQFKLPGDKIVIKDLSVKLPEITDIYEDTNRIRWQATQWNIDRSEYKFNASYKVIKDTIATLECEKVKVTLTYKNETGLEITDFPNPDYTKYECGDKAVLQKLTDKYTDTSDTNIKWEATKWIINESEYALDYSFNIYENTTAYLKCEKIKVTLKFVNDKELIISNFPESKEYTCGDPAELPDLSGEYEALNNIIWKATGWSINERVCDFGSSFNIYEDTDATLKCEKANVTLTFTSDYQHFIMPDVISRASGTSVILPPVDKYTDEDAGKIYTPIKWNIGNFNTSYTLYKNTEAKLDYSILDVPVGITIHKKSITLTEGASTQITFKLLSKPRADVILNLSSSSSRLSISKLKLTFTESNWDNEQSIEFTAIDNSIADGDIRTTVSVSASSDDERYNALQTETLTVFINDNDTADIDYNNSAMNLVESESATRAFKLKSQPTGNVTLNITSNNSTRLNISPSSITFTQANWHINKSVTFTAIDNTAADGDVTVNVSISSSSSDSSYNGLTRSFNVAITDNDTSVFGKLAFESDYFAVDVDPTGYTVPYIQKGEPKPFDNTTEEYKVDVKTQWNSVYTSDTDYTVYQVPKSPKPGKPFEYDLIYDDHINVTDE